MRAAATGPSWTSRHPWPRATRCCPRRAISVPRAGEPLGHARSLGVPEVRQGEIVMIGILIAVLLAALVYWLCVMLGLPSIVGIVAAILVLLAGVGTGGYGHRGWGGRRL